jgi:hypothetical protein
MGIKPIVSPARTFVNLRLREAAAPLCASGRQRKSQERLKIFEENFCLFPKITIFAE